MTAAFRWLHLTDLHVGMRDGEHLWPQVEAEVLRDLDVVVGRLGGVDVVFFTGDLAFSGHLDQYARFETIWGTVRARLQAIGCDPAFVAVPGNHDLKRPSKGNKTAARLRGWADDPELRRRFWAKPTCRERKLVDTCFAAWTSWSATACDWDRFTDVHRDGVLPGDFAATWTTDGGHRIGILALNTAALQLGGGDYAGRLTLHASQLTPLVGKLYAWVEAHDVCVLLTHHDPTWLDAEGRRTLKQDIAVPGRFAVHLCGHRHAQQHTTVIAGGADAKRLHIGRSLFGLEHWNEREERLHGYGGGRIELDATRTLRLWPRADVVKQAEHRRIERDQSFDHLQPDDGTRPEDLGPSLRGAPPSSHLVTPAPPSPDRTVPPALAPTEAASQPERPSLCVFISYSHDDEDHARRVRELADRLVRDGIDVDLDQYLVEPPEGWTVWMERRMSAARRVVLVCTEHYLARWGKTEPDGVGRGVKYEAGIARALFMRDDVRNRRFTPVHFGPADACFVPLALSDWNHYDVQTEAGYAALVQHLEGKPGATKPPLGRRRDPRSATAASGDEDDPGPGDLDGLLTSGVLGLPETPSPATLLLARFGVVPFAHRDDELGLLDAWADRDSPVSILLVHGAGGTGKTRLASEWASRRRAVGWHAGFFGDDGASIAAESGAVTGWADAMLASEAPVVGVVDYAESRRWLGTLLQRLARDDARPAAKVRVLLLARHAGDWWAALPNVDADQLRRLLEGSPQPLALGPLVHATVAAQQAEADRAAAAFAEHFRRAAPVGVPSPRSSRRERALYLHMAALDAVLVGAGDGAPQLAGAAMPTDEADTNIRDAILGHERRFWIRHLGLDSSAGTVAPWVRALDRVMAGSTLLGGIRDALALRALLGRKGAGDEDLVEKVVTTVHRLYGTPDRLTGPLEPDLLGEWLVYRVLSDRTHLDRPLERWLAAADANQLSNALTVLGRIEVERPEAGEWCEAALEADLPGRADAALNAALALAADTAEGRLGARLARLLFASGGSTELADRVSAAMPPAAQTVSLLELGHWAHQTRRGSLPPDAAAVTRAVYAGEFALWASAVGDHEGALLATEEAVRQFRQPADEGDAHARAHLAAGLNNLGVMLSAVGRREEALAVSKEAVETYRILASSRPDAFLPKLAGGLINLGTKLSALGRREEALEATNEAVTVYRSLAATRPDAFLPALATSLNNLGNGLSNLGRPRKALAATEEAVQICRRLALSRPDAFLPRLAMSLNNLGAMLSGVGGREQALVVVKEAVEIRRGLALWRPDVFLPDLAGSLANLGKMLSALGRREEALAAAQDAVEAYRGLASMRPDAFRPALASSLDNLGIRLGDLGHQEEALAATQEAVTIRRDLAASLPDAFLPDLANSFNNLGLRLSEVGRLEDALAATEEAVEIRRSLAASRPDAFLGDFATSLHNLGKMLSDLNRAAEALLPSEEAVSIYRDLVLSLPDAFRPHLASSLNNLGTTLNDLGRQEEATAALAEAVASLRALAKSHPQAFLGDLAATLNNLGAVSSAAGRQEEALAATNEAIDILRGLAAARPNSFLPDLARSLRVLGSIFAAGGDDVMAGAQFREGLEALWPLFERAPRTHAALVGGLLEDCLVAHRGSVPAWLVPYIEGFSRLRIIEADNR